MSIKKILFGFFLIAFASVASVSFTIYKMQILTDNMLNIFIHPFQVNNAVAEIYTGVTVMDRDLKAAIHVHDIEHIVENIRVLNQKIHQQEERIEYNFAIIYENYLGDNHDIDNAYHAFIRWKTLAGQLSDLLRKGKNHQANQLHNTQGIEAIEHFYQQNKVLNDFAVKKASEYHSFSVVNSNQNTVTIILSLTLIFSGFITFYIVKNLFALNQNYQHQLYLLDQNILTATLTRDKKVVDISYALCRILKLDRDATLHSVNDCFFTDEQQFLKFEQDILSGIPVSREVYIHVAGQKLWFHLEVIPESSHGEEVDTFNLFFNDITDKKLLEKLSITDNMTGLYNRNYFDSVFPREFRRAKRDEKLFSVVLLDIDFFKQYNDTYGHQEGDKALIAVAKVLIDQAKRSSDFAFRVGGEEFLILTNQKDFISLELFALNIIHSVEALKIPHEPSTVSEFLTVSAGAIQVSYKEDMTPDEVYKAADELLYQAKSAGRNGLKVKSVV
ncbi:GGDEF domain-containing protein [Thalassomonas actiniarum]|uniref:diguanylate cyclase n=1 Tax=Thalassomonas actiniarum TaxID=485447 RepID=A0AAE9YN47_9GAMM|nr:sensor domain-containing diguanylate cyclase [Thalassomonas actiniarum]WDD97169.1 sensor domain-containing diguanylate cyclase [Thalassomonas actiniarum]